MKNLKELKPLWNLVKKEKFKIIIASILIFLCGLCEIFTGYLNGAALDEITKLNVVNSLIYLGIYFCIGIIANSLLSVKASVMFQKIENVIIRKLSFFTYKKSLDLPAYAYEKTSSGEIINRITNDTDVISSSFEQLVYIFSSLVGSIIILIYIFFNSWIIGVEIIIFIIILFFIIRKYNPLLKNCHKEIREENDKFTSMVTESIRGVREIKTLGIKNNVIKDVKEIIKYIYNKEIDETNIWEKFTMLTRILKTSLEVLVFSSCVILVYYKQVSLTFFVAMTYYIYRYMYLIENINGLTQTYQKVIVSLSRVNDILGNRLYEDEKFGNKILKKVKGVIEFKNVSFSYPNEDIILNNFNLKLEPNKKIAIVGKSGQGKTTLFNLLTRVFDANSGEILIDGINIKDLTEESLRKNISIIRQEPFIFNRSIKDNFKLINSKISLSKIKQYSKIAYLDDYIESLPNKYDTIMGEGGVNLSGGQKQRLSIARALAKESKIVLFDEATSALDNNSQEYIKKAIDNLIKDHTVVIIAHRLSTIIDSDIIYVVNDGKIVASGKHNELLLSNKIYRNLYENEDEISE